MLQTGQKAPNFKLYDQEKKEVSLDDFKGKPLVIFFFPMAWTGVCTKEMCSVQDDYKSYADLGVNVIGISVDSHLALKRFSEDNKIQYPLLSDFNKTTINDYGVVQAEFSGNYRNVAKRCVFVLDKDGIVRYTQVTPTPGDLPDMEPVKAAVNSLTKQTA